MYTEWMGFEQYRIHVMERWPDCPRKRAGLASASSALDGIARSMSNKGSVVPALLVPNADGHQAFRGSAAPMWMISGGHAHTGPAGGS